MLSEEYLWSIPDSVVKIWEELEEWLIKDICERIMAAELYDYDKIPGIAQWRIKLLSEAGMHYNDLISVISKVTRKSEAEVKKLFEESGLEGLMNEAKMFERQGIEPLQLMESSVLKTILQDCYNRTNGELRNFTRTTANASQKLLIDTLDKAYFDVTTGARSYSEVIREAVDTVGKQSGVVLYNSGHRDTIETAVRRSVLTGINQGAGKISIENAKELGAEYVVVSAHPGARTSEDPIADHSGWQGKIYKIEGEDQYPNLEESTGFPSNPLGLCGYNCRHSIHAYFLGEPNPFEDVVKDKKASDKLYDLSQKQRQQERNIRKTKKQLMAYETAIENCRDEQAKFKLQMEYDKLAAKLQKQNKRYKDFCKENEEYGIKTEQERLRTLNWKRENADKARSGAYRHKAAKNTSTYSDKKKSAARISTHNSGQEVVYNEKYDYSINLPEYSTEVNKGMSTASRNVALNGSMSKYEYLQLVDLKNGTMSELMTDKDYGSVGSRKFWEFININQDKEFAFIHNHNRDSSFSETDLRTLLANPNIKIMIAVRNDAVKYIATRKGDAMKNVNFDKLYQDDIQKLNNQYRNGIITAAERTRLREETIVNNLLRDYTEQKGLFEIDGRN